MFQALLIPLAISAILFIGYLFLRAYKPQWFRFGRDPVPPRPAAESFVPPAPPQPPLAVAPPPVPAAAPPVKEEAPMEPREIAAGGPSTPNAQAPSDRAPTMSPEAAPLDPYDDRNMEAPVHDSMRHPELSFGPGVDNTRTKMLAASGVGSASTLSAETPFSPDFAQNGGSFMGEIFANDLKKESFFAEA